MCSPERPQGGVDRWSVTEIECFFQGVGKINFLSVVFRWSFLELVLVRPNPGRALDAPVGLVHIAQIPEGNGGQR